MRAILSSRSMLAAAELSAAALAPAAAQQAAAPAPARPAVEAAAPAPREVAIYRFSSPRATGLPTQVTVADSAGQLVASYQLRGSRAALPMEVTQLGTDLVLQAETPEGVLTMQLYGQTDPATATPLSGRWWLGDQAGILRGRANR